MSAVGSLPRKLWEGKKSNQVGILLQGKRSQCSCIFFLVSFAFLKITGIALLKLLPSNGGGSFSEWAVKRPFCAHGFSFLEGLVACHACAYLFGFLGSFALESNLYPAVSRL